MKHARLILGVAAIAGIAFAFLFLTAAWLGALQIPDIHSISGTNEVALQVSVNSTNPLILAANMKSTYNTTSDDSAGFMLVGYSDTEFDYGYIKDENQTVVAQCPRTFPFGSNSDGRGHYSQHFIVSVLPINSEKTVNLNFNTTLPPGNYNLTLHTQSHTLYSADFTLP